MSGSTKRKLFEKEKDKGGERASERERERVLKDQRLSCQSQRF